MELFQNNSSLLLCCVILSEAKNLEYIKWLFPRSFALDDKMSRTIYFDSCLFSFLYLSEPITETDGKHVDAAVFNVIKV